MQSWRSVCRAGQRRWPDSAAVLGTPLDWRGCRTPPCYFPTEFNQTEFYPPGTNLAIWAWRVRNISILFGSGILLGEFILRKQSKIWKEILSPQMLTLAWFGVWNREKAVKCVHLGDVGQSWGSWQEVTLNLGNAYDVVEDTQLKVHAGWVCGKHAWGDQEECWDHAPIMLGTQGHRWFPRNLFSFNWWIILLP